jgi:two-component system, LytTR family, sensor histidine kinase AlgZ
MPDRRLLSTLPATDRPTPGLDACQPGVVLRAVLGAQTLLALWVMFEHPEPGMAFVRYAVLTVGILPATLLWLLLACASHRITRHKPGFSPTMALLLAGLQGACCGGMGFALLWALGQASPSHWLASTSTGALMGAVFFQAWQWRTQALQPSATQARLNELQSRIRPHFLFNTLNSAIALVRAEPARAEALLEDLAELFRQVMRDPGQTHMADELALARRYLDIEQVRFGQRLRIQWQLDPLAMQARLPCLVLQPLLENAVRHGVEPSESGADIHIQTRRRAGMVEVLIRNTMPAGPGVPGHGMALANVKERLALMHDVQGRLQHSVTGDCFEVSIEVPA